MDNLASPQRAPTFDPRIPGYVMFPVHIVVFEALHAKEDGSATCTVYLSSGYMRTRMLERSSLGLRADTNVSAMFLQYVLSNRVVM